MYYFEKQPSRVKNKEPTRSADVEGVQGESKEEGGASAVGTELSVERLPLTKEQMFSNIKSAMEGRGVSVEIIPAGSAENAQYIPDGDVIRVREGNLDEMVEEAFHRSQYQYLVKEGYLVPGEKEFDSVVKYIAEIEAVTRSLQNLYAKFEEVRTAALDRIVQEGKTAQWQSALLDDLDYRSVQEDISLEQTRLNLYTELLTEQMRKMPSEEKKKYQKLSGNHLFQSSRKYLDIS